MPAIQSPKVSRKERRKMLYRLEKLKRVKRKRHGEGVSFRESILNREKIK